MRNYKFQISRFRFVFVSLILLLSMTNCQTEETVFNKAIVENTTQKTIINSVSLAMIPKIKDKLNGIKRVKKSTSNLNKSTGALELNEKKIIELIKENGDKTYSFIIETELDENDSYSVENLNIMERDGEFQSFVTKWIPSDGKPFYDAAKFVGELQYFDLNNNLLHVFKIGESNQTAKLNKTAKSQLVIQIGCWSYEMIPCGCSGSNYEIISSTNTCSGGGGTTSGGTTGTGTTGSGSGGSYSGSGTTTFVPNIPTEDEVEKKMYNTFLTSLNKDQYSFLGYNQTANLDIFTYIQGEGFTSTSKNFAKELINVLIVTDAVDNLSNTITGDPIEFYLVLQYKHSNLLNLSSFSINSNSIHVGTYTLLPHYKKDGTLVFYTAARYSSTTGAPVFDIEYIIKPSGLAEFQNKIVLYTAAADLFYLNGIPSQGQIAMAVGHYVVGLKNMWVDALTNPMYYVYLGHIFVGCATNLQAVNSTETTFEGKIKFTNNTNPSSDVSIDINNRSYTQYRQLIQDKYPNTSWTPNASGEVDLLIPGNIKYVERFQNSSGYIYVIDYYRNGELIGKFRFNY